MVGMLTAIGGLLVEVETNKWRDDFTLSCYRDLTNCLGISTTGCAIRYRAKLGKQFSTDTIS